MSIGHFLPADIRNFYSTFRALIPPKIGIAFDVEINKLVKDGSTTTEKLSEMKKVKDKYELCTKRVKLSCVAD